jgi:aspartokinase-like uncharacterized kinase
MADGSGKESLLPPSAFILPPSSFCLRVVKLGGSLLDFDGMVPALRSWLEGQPVMPSLMVVGGGSLADAVRDARARHALDDEAAHWLCIRLLGVTADLVARLLPEARLIRRLDELRPLPGGEGLWILEPESFLRDEELPIGANTLPHTWDVTSDSIAARLAVALGTRELVLLKSGLPPTSDLDEAARSGYVDAYFPRAALGVPAVRCVNLRAGGFPQVEMRRPGSRGQRRG